jgi:2-polyprenyl-6-methoxyphenol hydroxylase-like FAD-dependent oxidoreductase
MVTPLKILIAGGGVGGLALAQGLKKAGHVVKLYERAAAGGATGYRLHMNGDGGNALQALLPPSLFQLYLDTSRKDPWQEGLFFYDKHLRKLGGRPHLGAKVTGRPKDTAANRATLREVLLIGLDDVVVPADVEGYEETADGVEVILTDGHREKGDVLVGYDGMHSRIRRAKLPKARVMETGVFGIYGRTPLPKSLTPELMGGFVIVFGPKVMENGVLSLGVYDPRVPPATAAAKNGVAASLSPVTPYMMLAAGLPTSMVREKGLVPETVTPQQMKDALREMVQGWDKQLIAMVEASRAEDFFATRMRYIDAPDTWTPSRVTLAGDAIHGMPPTMGVGANLALRDAEVLAGKLNALRSSDRAAVIAAIASYEAEMRGYAFPMLRQAITQEGSASGFTPIGLLRLIKLVGLKSFLKAARARKETFARPDNEEEKRS